jgi:hypothetical protein
MDDMVLRATLDDGTTLYVSPIDADTYAEYVVDDNLGGSGGYFVARSFDDGVVRRFEILAKSSSFDAAGDLFDLIVGTARRQGLPSGS